MNEFIKINRKNKTARILLGESYESFELYTKDWTFEQYIQQWRDAVKLLLDADNTVCLIKQYESAKKHVKKMCLYTIFSKESAYPLYNEIDDDVFFITESFIFITENTDFLTNKFYFDKIFKSYSNYFPIYYFNSNHIEHFYLYLSERTNGISVWEVSRQQLNTFLNIKI